MINTNKTNKTGRKNNTKQAITWPSAEFFTHNDLVTSNPSSYMKDITLRTKYKKEVANGKLKEIGVMPNGKGRPHNVYSLNPTKNVIENAKQAGIMLHSQYLVEKVADISKHSFQSTTKKSDALIEAINNNAIPSKV